MSDEKCFLSDPDWHQCCCNCKYLKPTHEHCSTNMGLRDQIAALTGVDKCICKIQNGWACCIPGSNRIHTNWSHHSVGCECYTAKDEIEKMRPSNEAWTAED